MTVSTELLGPKGLPVEELRYLLRILRCRRSDLNSGHHPRVAVNRKVFLIGDLPPDELDQ